MTFIGDFRVGEWYVEPQLNCVRHGDQSIHVEPKVMQVLVQLASHGNEVLSKEQLIHAVWSDTFVGDEALTRCISEIRRAFNDDARSPRFVQTIPKVGYRLIAPVERTQPAKVEPPVVPAKAPPAEKFPQQISVSAPSVSRATIVLLALVAALGILAAWYFKTHRASQPEAQFKILPFTSYSGSQSQPAFSPDGNRIAFIWGGEGGEYADHEHVYVKVIGTENPVRLTSGVGDDYSPVWSPDGSYIAYLRASEDNDVQGLYIIPSVGGPARKVYARTGVIDASRRSITWAPDGTHIVIADGKSTRDPSALYSLDLNTQQATRITHPDTSWDGDYSPTYSPDGQSIAFVRDLEASVRDIYVMPAAGGEAKRITRDNRQVTSLTWSRDGNSLIYASDRGGKLALWRVPVDGGDSQRLSVGTEDANFPAISPKGDKLAYTQTTAQWSIMRVELNGAKPTVTALLSSTEQDSAPRFSPDGTRIAFQSWRSGTQEVWLSDNNGAGTERLTSFNGPLTGSPNWSPDGKQIVFDSRPEGRPHIYIVSSSGGVPRQVTSGEQNDIIPSWSRDMKSVYYSSNRSGSWEIWNAPITGGVPRQITTSGGFVGVESFDSQWVYFTKADTQGLWRVPTAGGPEEQIINYPRSGYWGYFGVTKEGIYYLEAAGSSQWISFFDTATRRSKRLYTLDHTPPVYNGLTVTQDGKTIVYTDATPAGSHITLVDEYR